MKRAWLILLTYLCVTSIITTSCSDDDDFDYDDNDRRRPQRDRNYDRDRDRDYDRNRDRDRGRDYDRDRDRDRDRDPDHRPVRVPPPGPIVPPSPKKAGKVEEKGIEYLLSQQNPDGSFGKPEGRSPLTQFAGMNESSYKCKKKDFRKQLFGTLAMKPEPVPGAVGRTAAAVYALMKQGARGKHLQKGLHFLMNFDTANTYAIGMRCRVWHEAHTTGRGTYMQYFQHDANRLIYSNHKDLGGWDCSIWDETRNNLSSFYAVTGVHLYRCCGGTVPGKFYALAMKHFQKGQKSDGSWGLLPADLKSVPARGPALRPGAMVTGAGVASMFTCIDAEYRSKNNDCKDKPLDPSISRGLGALEQELQAGGPRKAGQFGRFLFNLMCAMQYDGRKTLGRVDWSSTGIEQLAKMQNGNGSWCDSIHETAFALAFLADSRPQILINKLAFRGDWNNRPMAVLSVVQWINRNCQQRSNWQVVDFQSPGLYWHAAPILYISGSKKPDFTDREMDRLRKFVQNGGTIISVTECKGDKFKKGIREIYRRAFPRSRLEKLDDRDPIYNRPHKVKPKYPLFVISNGRRPIVIHTDTDVAKHWQTGITPGTDDEFRLGENIIRSVVNIK